MSEFITILRYQLGVKIIYQGICKNNLLMNERFHKVVFNPLSS